MVGQTVRRKRAPSPSSAQSSNTSPRFQTQALLDSLAKEAASSSADLRGSYPGSILMRASISAFLPPKPLPSIPHQTSCHVHIAGTCLQAFTVDCSSSPTVADRGVEIAILLLVELQTRPY